MEERRMLIYRTGLLMVLMLVVGLTQAASHDRLVQVSVSPTWTPSPSAPPPTIPIPTPTATQPPAAMSPMLPDNLQPITRANAANLEILSIISCQVDEDALYNQLQDAAFAPSGNRLAIAVQNGVCLYDLDTPGREPLLIPVLDTTIRGVLFSPDGQSIYTLHNANDTLNKWDATTGEQQRSGLNVAFAYGNGHNLAFSPDGQLLAVGLNNGLRLWDAVEEVPVLRTYTGFTAALAWNGDGTRLAAVDSGGLGLYTLHPGPRLFRDDLLPLAGNITDITIGGPDGNLLVYAASDTDGLQVMNMDTGQVVASPMLDRQELAFSPADDRLLLGADCCAFGLWDIERDAPVWTGVGNFQFFWWGIAAFNADATLIASNTEQDIILWGVPDTAS